MTTANGWPQVPLSEILTQIKRDVSVVSHRDYELLGARWYAKGLYTKATKSGTQIKASKLYRVAAGDFVYNRLFAWKGSFAVASRENDGCFVSNEFPCFDVCRERALPEYLWRYFSRESTWNKALGLSFGATPTSRNRLKEQNLLAMSVPLPPLEEQQRIVAKIDRLAKRIEEAVRIREEAALVVEMYRRAKLRELTNRFHKFGPLETYLRCKPRNGWSPKCDNADNGTPVLTLSAVTGFSFRSAAFKRTSLRTDPKAHYWLRPGDLLVTRSNSPELVGHAAIYNGQPSPCIYSDLMMRVDVDPERADTNFIWRWLQTPVVREYIRCNAKGTSPTMKKISQGIVMGIPVPTDISLSEQRHIVSYFEGLQAKVDGLKRLQERIAAELDALLPSILDRAFKGAL